MPERSCANDDVDNIAVTMIVNSFFIVYLL